MAELALYGLGEMGAEIARCLASRGITLTAHDPLTGSGINAPNYAEGTLAESAAKAPVHLVVVKQPEHLETLLFGEDGLGALAPERSLIVLHTTVAPETARDLRRRIADTYGHTLIDAALSRGSGEISEGSLSLLVGATDADFATARPVLEHYADHIVHIGPPGSGMTAKLCNNWLLYSNRHALLQALKAGQALGLDVDVLRGALERSSGSSWALTHYSDLDAALLSGRGAPDAVRDRTASELRMALEMMDGTGAVPTTLRATLALVDEMGPGADS